MPCCFHTARVCLYFCQGKEHAKHYCERGKGKQIRLWAYELEFEHPVKKEMMIFKSIPPFVNLEYVKI